MLFMILFLLRRESIYVRDMFLGKNAIIDHFYDNLVYFKSRPISTNLIGFFIFQKGCIEYLIFPLQAQMFVYP